MTDDRAAARIGASWRCRWLALAGLVAAGAAVAPPRPLAADQTFENASVAFVTTYFREWSSPNAAALSYLNTVFPDRASYFDQSLDHAALMDAKRRFAERWPDRRFVARPGSLKVSCDARHLCTIWGLVDWQVSSPRRNAHASGTSVFSLQLQDGQTVVSEDGFVISRGHMMPPLPKAGETAAGVIGARKRQPPGQARDYGDKDIPALRTAYFAGFSDRDWVSDWLTDRRRFAGSARSLGQAGATELPDGHGQSIRVTMFQADQASIACVTKGSAPSVPAGTEVQLHGLVSIFIGETMYLADCSIR